METYALIATVIVSIITVVYVQVSFSKLEKIKAHTKDIDEAVNDMDAVEKNLKNIVIKLKDKRTNKDLLISSLYDSICDISCSKIYVNDLLDEIRK